MSAEVLREAAALMRSRAEAARGEGDVWFHEIDMAEAIERADLWDTGDDVRADGTHIASWHPGVALLVADWLDEAADHLAVEDGDDGGLGHICPTAIEGLECSVLGQALNVARAYLRGIQ